MTRVQATVCQPLPAHVGRWGRQHANAHTKSSVSPISARAGAERTLLPDDEGALFRFGRPRLGEHVVALEILPVGLAWRVAGNTGGAHEKNYHHMSKRQRGRVHAWCVWCVVCVRETQGAGSKVVSAEP